MRSGGGGDGAWAPTSPSHSLPAGRPIPCSPSRGPWTCLVPVHGPGGGGTARIISYTHSTYNILYRPRIPSLGLTHDPSPGARQAARFCLFAPDTSRGRGASQPRALGPGSMAHRRGWATKPSSGAGPPPRRRLVLCRGHSGVGGSGPPCRPWRAGHGGSKGIDPRCLLPPVASADRLGPGAPGGRVPTSLNRR